MAKIGKVAIVVVLAAAVVTVIATKKAATSASSPPGKVPAAGGLAPILEELGKECAGRLQVDFIDVNQNPDAAKPFGIKLIPTQVFLDASGKELWRHEGFISKEDILAKWKELGVDLPASPATSQPASTSIPAKSGST